MTVVDNFNDNSIDTGKWTTNTPVGTITETGGQLQISVPGTADWWNYTGNSPIIYTPLPENITNYAVTVKLTSSTLPSGTLRGLILYQDRANAVMFALANVSSSDIIRLDTMVSGSGTIVKTDSAPVSYNPLWLKITYTDGEYEFLYSDVSEPEDEDYTSFYTTSSLGFTPTDTGMFLRSGGSSASTDTFDDFELYVETNYDDFQGLISVNEEDYVDWLWQNEIEITGSVDGQLVDYCVNITVPYDNEFMRYDFGDIRFGTDYGLNLPMHFHKAIPDITNPYNGLCIMVTGICIYLH